MLARKMLAYHPTVLAMSFDAKQMVTYRKSFEDLGDEILVLPE